MELTFTAKEGLLVNDMLQFLQLKQGELIAKLVFSIHRRDFKTLRVRSWLSDSVINRFYCALMMDSKRRKRDTFLHLSSQL